MRPIHEVDHVIGYLARPTPASASPTSAAPSRSTACPTLRGRFAGPRRVGWSTGKAPPSRGARASRSASRSRHASPRSSRFRRRLRTWSTTASSSSASCRLRARPIRPTCPPTTPQTFFKRVIPYNSTTHSECLLIQSKIRCLLALTTLFEFSG